MLDRIDPWKIVIHSDRIKDILAGIISAPITLGIDISNLCNSNCIWCLFKEYKEQHPYIMEKRLIEKAIIEFEEIHGKGICISGGGEPLMNPEAEYAILKAKEAGLECALNTNGVKLNKLSLHAIDNLSYIRVSLDAGSRESYIKLHQVDDFNTVLNNIEFIKKNSKVVLGVGYLVHPENYKEIIDIAWTLDEMNVDYIQIRPLKNFILDEEQMEKVHSQIDSMREFLKIKVYESFSKMDETIRKKEKAKKCYVNQLVANVGPDGYVYVCCEQRGKLTLGNIKDQHLSDIWFSKMHREILDKIDISKCPPCKYAKANEVIERVFINDELNRNFL